MATTGLSDLGEEWVWKTTFRQDRINREGSFRILLYNDSVDNLDDTSDVSDISTEPNDGDYNRKSLSLDTTDLSLQISNGNMRVQGEVTFDTTNTTGTIDSWAALAYFESDIVGDDTSGQNHLIATGQGGSEDLSGYSSFDVTVNIELD